MSTFHLRLLPLCPTPPFQGGVPSLRGRVVGAKGKCRVCEAKGFPKWRIKVKRTHQNQLAIHQIHKVSYPCMSCVRFLQMYFWQTNFWKSLTECQLVQTT